MGKQKGNWAIGTLIIAAVGYITGILTAPKSGKETREDLHNAALRKKKDTENKLKDLHSELDELLGKVKTQTTDMKSTGKKELDVLIEKAKSAKQKAKETISGIHEGEAGDNQELQKAVDDVTNAISHLKEYIEVKTGKNKRD